MTTKRALKVRELINYRKQQASKEGTQCVPITPQERQSCSQGKIFLVVDDLGIEYIVYEDSMILNSAEDITPLSLVSAKFTFLRFVAVMLKFCSIMMVLGFTILSLSQGINISSLMVIFSGAMYGIFIYALGSLISLFLDIEENQRFQKAERQQQHKELMAKLSELKSQNQASF